MGSPILAARLTPGTIAAPPDPGFDTASPRPPAIVPNPLLAPLPPQHALP
ncbi:MAG: hypothetical protein ACO3B3_09225 [Cyanobium sp.]